jgi:hypothetical protein
MSQPAATLRPRHRGLPVASAEVRERSVRRRVGLIWGLLVVNVLTFYGSVLPIPSIAGKAIAQGSLPVALLLALTLNRRLILRPNVFLCLLSLLVAEAILTALQPQYFGTVYRTFRFTEFVVTLWLLTPWWGRRDLLLVRCHLKALLVVLASVVLGLLVAPGAAMTGGRLNGVLWGIPTTQVGHYAAVTLGLLVVLWMCGQVRGRAIALIVTGAVIIMILTHTRTALVGLVTGILVAGLSLIVAKARVRKFLVAASGVVLVGAMTLSNVITTWLARGEGTAQLANLSGRTKVWAPLLALPRTTFQEVLGFGISNDSFNGLPIDSNWLAAYQSQGLFGVILCAVLLLFLLVAVYFQPRGVRRALALFLVTFCLVSSFTEVGFINASMYLLDLTLAASLLVPVTERTSVA